MGGSSLAPEVIKRSFGAESFHVLDTTHPAPIRRLAETLDFDATLFIAASKSGTTLETRSHLDFFWERAGKRGEFFAAITDPGSELEQLAKERGFLGDLRRRADDRRALLGALGLRARAGRADGRRPRAAAGARRGDGRGLPRRGGQPGPRARARARQRLERGPRQGDDQPEPGRLRALGRAAARGVDRQGGQGPDPGAGGVARRARPPGARGAAAVAVRARPGVLPLGVRDRGRRLDPRDQPVRPAERPGREGQDERGARRAASRTSSRAARSTSCSRRRGRATTSRCRRSSTPSASPSWSRCSSARARTTGCVVTHGLGPRYLHSTGQLHKGGPNTGLFVQVVDDAGDELKIPGRDFGFRRLIHSQAAGDFASLEERGRRR